MKQETKDLIIGGIAFAGLVLAICFAIILLQIGQDSKEQKFLVVNITDGDTFEIATGEKVRLICVNAPEKGEKGYEEAKDFLSNLILGEEVRLEQGTEYKDSYGRLLKYVYLNTSGEEIFINKEIVQQGYGKLFPYGNNTEKCGEIAGVE